MLQQAGTDPADLAGLDSVAGVGRIGWDDDDDTASTANFPDDQGRGKPRQTTWWPGRWHTWGRPASPTQATAELGSLARMASSRYR